MERETTMRFVTKHNQYAEYNNRQCIITRALTSEEADLEETGPMYEVQFYTGESIHVFEDELEGGHLWKA